jgi:hypothetical protein
MALNSVSSPPMPILEKSQSGLIICVLSTCSMKLIRNFLYQIEKHFRQCCGAGTKKNRIIFLARTGDIASICRINIYVFFCCAI